MNYKFRHGDIVKIHAKVNYEYNDLVYLSIEGHVFALHKRDVELVSQPIKLNDLVLVLPGFVTGHVRGIANEHAWVELGLNVFTTERIEDLRRAQDSAHEDDNPDAP